MTPDRDSAGRCSVVIHEVRRQKSGRVVMEADATPATSTAPYGLTTQKAAASDYPCDGKIVRFRPGGTHRRASEELDRPHRCLVRESLPATLPGRRVGQTVRERRHGPTRTLVVQCCLFSSRGPRFIAVSPLESIRRCVMVESGILLTRVLFLSVSFACCPPCCPLARYEPRNVERG